MFTDSPQTPSGSLIDPYGRTFRYLRLSVTDLCNYRCNYCLPDGFDCHQPAHTLSVEQIHTIVSAFARQGIDKIRITGGEPALRRDLTDIIRTIKSVAGIEKIAMTTNGHHLSKNIQDWVDAGLDAINISCDSLDPRLFSAIVGRDALEELMQAIDATIATGIKTIKINAVLLRQFNLEQFADLIEWASNKPISLRFIELMQTQDNADYFKQNHVSAEVIETYLKQRDWQEQTRSYNAGPAREFSHPDKAGKVGFIAPYSKDFCQTCNRLRVSSQGKLHLCLFGEQGYDLSSYIENKDVEGLSQALNQLLIEKPETHDLQQGNSGERAHLAQIGG